VIRSYVHLFRDWWLSTFTLHRWALNPFQMYPITFLAGVAVSQLQLGASPLSVQADLERHTAIALAVCNIFGAGIALFGLHLRDLETALWVELYGYLCLIFVLGTYLYLLYRGQVNPGSTYGFGFSQAFVYAAAHRAAQILLYKRARGKRYKLAREATALQDTLNNILPHTSTVTGKVDEL
jgi:hypothetical protein